MFDLLLTMVERLGIIVTIAFVLTRFPFFRDLIYQEQLGRKQQFTAILFFGFFGIIGTYSGLTLSTESLNFSSWTAGLNSDEAIANSRVIGVVIAGLLGGYKVGIGAGIIAGLHRFTLGGFTAVSCGLAAIIAGILSGLFHRKNKHVRLPTAFLIGALAESVQMLIILLLSRPFEKAWTLVEIIGIPMVLANGLGSALFLLIIKSVINEEERLVAIQAQKTLRIAEKTLSYLRNGLSFDTAKAVCHILHNEIRTSAVSITSKKEILAHVGLGFDHHQAGSKIQTQITQAAIQKGETVVANKKAIQCREESCPLGAVVVAPLRQHEETIGTLKFYFRSEKEITPVIMELVSGLSSLLSNQLEMGDVDRAHQLAKEAEIKALQAQISPHFLFNTLNTILSLIRLDPMKARKLLVSLSHFLRQNLSVTTQSLTTLDLELKHVKAYLAIEEARFANKLSITYDIDEALLMHHLPPLTLQPLVENSIKHGFKNKDTGCLIQIFIKKEPAGILVKIVDNGEGIPTEKLAYLLHQPAPSENGNGVALYNVNRRLSFIFGDKAPLHIQSTFHEGTSIEFYIPTREVDESGTND